MDRYSLRLRLLIEQFALAFFAFFTLYAIFFLIRRFRSLSRTLVWSKHTAFPLIDLLLKFREQFLTKKVERIIIAVIERKRRVSRCDLRIRRRIDDMIEIGMHLLMLR